jgi:predicted transposase YdaD
MATAAERLRREGRIEGKLKGKHEAIERLLRQRFGALPAAAAARIEQAGEVELDAWSLRILTASSLEEVLATKARRKT